MIDQRLSQENICLSNKLAVLGTNVHASDSTNVTPLAQHQPSHQRMLILLIFAIELTVSSLFGFVFKLKSRKFCDFNEIIVFVFDLQYDFDYNCDALITLTNETIGVTYVAVAPASNSYSKGVGLTEFSIIVWYLSAALTAASIITILANENEKQMKSESCLCLFHVGGDRYVTYIKDTVDLQTATCVASDTGSQGTGSVFKEGFKHLELSYTLSKINNKTKQNNRKTNKKKIKKKKWFEPFVSHVMWCVYGVYSGVYCFWFLLFYFMFLFYFYFWMVNTTQDSNVIYIFKFKYIQAVCEVGQYA